MASNGGPQTPHSQQTTTDLPIDLPLSTQNTEQITTGLNNEQKTRGIKRKAPVDNQLYSCEVCHIQLNSASQAFQHFQGRSHTAKVRVLEQAVEVNQPPVMPQHPPQEHFTQPSHLRPPQENFTRPNHQCPPQRPPNPNLNHQSILAPTEPANDIDKHCSLCQKWFNSKGQAEQHYSGKAHQNNMFGGIATGSIKPNNILQPEQNWNTTAENSQEIATPNQDLKLGGNVKAQLFTCQPCNITLNSEKQMSQHMSGLRHKIIVGKAKPPPPPNPEETVGWQGIRYKKLASTMTKVGPYASPALVGSNLPPGGTKMGQYYCQDCDISMNSQKQMEQHISSAKHKEGMKGGKRKVKGRGIGVFRGANSPGGLAKPKPPPISSSFVRPQASPTNTFLSSASRLPQDPQPATTCFPRSPGTFQALAQTPNGYSIQSPAIMKYGIF